MYNKIMKLLIYADDMVIFSDNEKGLQHEQDQLDLYCSKWGIKVNVKKLKLLFLRRAQWVEIPVNGSIKLKQ